MKKQFAIKKVSFVPFLGLEVLPITLNPSIQRLHLQNNKIKENGSLTYTLSSEQQGAACGSGSVSDPPPVPAPTLILQYTGIDI
jgi:hypothetical protein